MSKDICGYEDTVSGEPCKHPAGGCPVPSHSSDDEDVQDHGRPSKYDDDLADQAVRAAERGTSKAGCARAAGIGEATLERWLEKNPEYNGGDFRSAFRRARAKGEGKLISDGLYDPDVDSSMAKFMLASSFDYKKTEKQEVTGDDGGPVEISFTEQVVETPWSEEESE